MPEPTPRLTSTQTADGNLAQPQGEWVAARLAEEKTWEGLSSALKQMDGAGAKPAHWDLRELSRMDHTGAQLLWNSWGRRWPERLQAHPAQQAMLERVAHYSSSVPPQEKVSWAERADMLGRRVLRVAWHLQGVLRLLGQLLIDTLRLLRHPAQGPWRDFSGHLYHIGATALPITALVGFLIGVVLAYLISQQLQLFGADPFIVNILGISVIRELGPVLAAILIAGRSGSTITAQIGVMRVTEEIDAMRVLGIPRGFRLVLPRVLAMALAMPLLSAWTTLAALMGGLLASDVVMGITPSFFFSSMPDAVQASNLTLATAKSAVFGVMIALVGCHFGLRVKPNTESLGQGTTASVVTSITLVILVDALFAVVFKDVGI